MSDKWIEIDGSKQSFGRIATKIALLLQGKDLPEYDHSKMQAPNIIVVNCKDLRISERRANATYYSHSGYLGNMKEKIFSDKTNSDRLKNAVNNMLPKTKSRKKIVAHLKCFEDSEHPHKAQIK